MFYWENPLAFDRADRFSFFSGILSGILSVMQSGILSGIPSGICLEYVVIYIAGFLSGISPGILNAAFSEISSDIDIPFLSFGISRGCLSGIYLCRIVSEKSFLFYARGAVQQEHWAWMIVVEVRQGRQGMVEDNKEKYR